MAGALGTVRGVRVRLAVGLLLVAAAACAQSAPPRTVDEALHRMSDEAGVIFAGQVTAIHHETGENGASGVVEVEFRVDQAVRGCAAGTPYVLREWAGLWAGGARRYRIGGRLLMFLRTPGASGLSSPVDGMDGAVPIQGGESPFLAGGSAVGYPVADLRWVSTEVLRPVVYQSRIVHSDHRSGRVNAPVARRAMVRSAAESVEFTRVFVEPEVANRDPEAAPATKQQASVASLIAKLKSWQKADDASH